MCDEVLYERPTTLFTPKDVVELLLEEGVVLPPLEEDPSAAGEDLGASAAGQASVATP